MSSVTLFQLESHLWEAANILRGPVDAADFKTYVFPMLFFKRISDVHDEEYQEALKEFGGDRDAALFPENYRFQVPDGCHWSQVRAITVNVGKDRRFADVEGVARVVTLEEIAANDHNLNIPRYVEPKAEQEALTVDEAMMQLRESVDAAFAAEEKLLGLLKREGLLK
jgi:type I restriction-modification system DNA methylase subunit